MPRQISASMRYALERPETGEALLVFLTITHPELSTAIRVVSDAVDYVWNGETYIGFPFDISLISDGDGPPKARLSVQNVDRRIGEAVRRLSTPPRLRIDLIAASLFDDLTITGTPVTDATEGEEYEGFIVTASGGVPPYTFSVVSGALPAGITLDAETGIVSGTPTEAGTFEDIVIEVEDSGPPEPDYTADHLFIANVTGDLFLEGEIRGWDYVQEVWPGIRATQNRLPGLYR